MTPEQLVAALTSEIEELRLAIRAEQLQPEGAISPEWIPDYRGYVNMLTPERRLRTSAFNDGRVLWCVERGWTDKDGWHHWTTEWTGRWISTGPNSAMQEMASGLCQTQREAMRAAESMLITYEAPQ